MKVSGKTHHKISIKCHVTSDLDPLDLYKRHHAIYTTLQMTQFYRNIG